MLAKRSQKKVENIFRGVGGAGQDRLDTDEILKYEYASAPTKVIFTKDIEEHSIASILLGYH